MIAWLKRLFGGKPKPEVYIAPGQLWALEPDPDPWGGVTYPPVRIIDVRGDWVRYCIGGAFSDCRKTRRDFLMLYTRVSDAL